MTHPPQLIVPWFYRQLRFSSGQAQRLGGVVDHFSGEGIELTLVLEIARPDTLWIRPGAVTDPRGLVVIAWDGGVLDVGTRFYRPADDPTRVPNAFAAGILVARGEAALDLNHYALAGRHDLERDWGTGAFDAAERVATGDSAPRVEATCSSCRLRQPLTFAKRTCTRCNTEMPPYRTLAQQERRPQAWRGPFA